MTAHLTQTLLQCPKPAVRSIASRLLTRSRAPHGGRNEDSLGHIPCDTGPGIVHIDNNLRMGRQLGGQVAFVTDSYVLGLSSLPALAPGVLAAMSG